MLDQFKRFAINNIVKKLNEHGLHVDPQTLEKAIENSPFILQQIEGILMSSNSKDRFQKIQALLNKATSENNTTSKSK